MGSEPRLVDTISEQICRRLRDDIVFGRLAPGQKLRLERLRVDYDVSVATLREVLPRLAAEGLIRFETQKGFEVCPVSARDLSEISDMRILLECHAAEESLAKGDLDWEADLVAAHHRLSRMEARMLAGDRSVTAEWKRYDRAFHRALIAACGSTELLATYDRIFDRFLRYQMLLVMFRGDVATKEHQDLLTAALDRDAETVKGLLTRHIGACIEYTVQHGLLKQEEDA